LRRTTCVARTAAPAQGSAAELWQSRSTRAGRSALLRERARAALSPRAPETRRSSQERVPKRSEGPPARAPRIVPKREQPPEEIFRAQNRAATAPRSGGAAQQFQPTKRSTVVSRTLILVKPDAFERGPDRRGPRPLRAQGPAHRGPKKMRGMKVSPTSTTPSTARSPSFGELVAFITRPVGRPVLEGEEPCGRLAADRGDPTRSEAAPGSIAATIGSR